MEMEEGGRGTGGEGGQVLFCYCSDSVIYLFIGHNRYLEYCKPLSNIKY